MGEMWDMGCSGGVSMGSLMSARQSVTITEPHDYHALIALSVGERRRCGKDANANAYRLNHRKGGGSKYHAVFEFLRKSRTACLIRFEFECFNFRFQPVAIKVAYNATGYIPLSRPNFSNREPLTYALAFVHPFAANELLVDSGMLPAWRARVNYSSASHLELLPVPKRSEAPPKRTWYHTCLNGDDYR